MNLQQFRFVRETIRRNFNLTEAARSLFTSQPGVSKSILEFEDELGIKIFERHGKRIKGLTKPGAVVAQVIDRIMREVDNLKKVSDEFARRDEGGLVIACTHAQARYILPKVIPAFRERFPKVRVSLAEGNPPALAQMVLHEQADVAIATETLVHTQGLAALPVYSWEHIVVVRPDHPLAELTSQQAKNLTLAQVAQYPIVTYDRQFSGRCAIDEAFAAGAVTPDIVLEAIDADVIKTYVDVGLGIGIIAGMAFDPQRDKGLVGLPVGHLFGTHTTRVAIKSGVFLRDYVYVLLEMLASNLTREVVQEALEKSPQAEEPAIAR
ncbi:CysB family HTH-type transcriptional regulator [Eoetvoesiella caeni]|uniref:LysR family cys regulon transcriptional activator n=1 Tax=Eoetvoesiella caeni TaxID=645616 RepID=A0A366HKJ6_9BURK|nr:CysB family HTH-type transcriptional regulator [Eoetvoesiella caeni]MCI2807149.1 CysB family HTH-type transcriptional regulator [Eoetvoesiella caeni]NYT53454.1 CysB family HTH-type transcriptional regulator [Eoetvoesiella caeni]RBP43440.1 LysR family cys regulon transcriptional activator [Eoetvoesiella caeni]